MAMDIYLWLVSRLPRLPQPLYVSWEQLAAQFGSQAQDLQEFKKQFRPALEKALEHYPGAKVLEEGAGQGKNQGSKGLVLYRSKPALVTGKSAR